jgi:hypothetical protein
VKLVAICSIDIIVRRLREGEGFPTKRFFFRILILSKFSFPYTGRVIVQKNYIESILEKAG